MKIYIIGIVGTGKTTLAKKLSNLYNIPYYELDGLVYENNIKRNNNDILKDFNEIINNDSWIIEDCLRPIFKDGLIYSDKIILIDLPKYIRTYRLITRFIKQKLNIEKSIYKQNLKELKLLLKYSKEYELDKENRMKLIEDYLSKTIIIKNNKELKKLVK